MAAYLKPYLKQLIIGPLFKLIEAVLELFMPIYMAKIIDIGIANGDTDYIIKNGFIMLGIAATGLVSAIICQYSAAVAAQNFGTSLRNLMFKKIMSLSFKQINIFGAQTLFGRVTNDVSQLQNAVNMTIRLVVRAPFICIGSVIATLIIDWKLGLIVLGVLPVYVFCLYLIMKKTSPLYTQVQRNLDDVSGEVMQTLSGVRVIRAFATEDREKADFTERNNELVDSTIKVGRISSLVSPVTMLITNISIIGIIWVGGIRINVGGLSQGELLAVISYITQILHTLIVGANLVILFTRAGASLKRVNEIFDIPVDETEINGEELLGNPTSEYAVEFENVTFSYNGTEPELENISFSLKHGKTMGIIGATGSGKSTLINLIPRFYLPMMGKMKINGISTADYNLKSLRNLVGIVPQKSELITGTIADNLRLGNQTATIEQLRAAAKTAQAAEFIEGTAKGYESFVNKNGSNFSGGQKQRIAIARAIAKNPEILILDDSSSALDFATDSALRKAIRKDCKGTTTIIVSQRIWAVKECDMILVLDDGKVAGIGTHDYLMGNCSEYRDIAQSQQNGGEAI
ncbi:MAG: ABC transporter ATP-binding protein [Oscillospiraceae bacterium]|nr:ABC transporter ATP-binding protein [Oscillospiraceae bacterium]